MSIIDTIQLEPGTLRDYHALARFHYRGPRPATVSGVFRLVYRAPSVVGRYLGRRDETQVVGVLVRSRPRLGCRMRGRALGGRYRGLSSGDRARAINREVRTISRVVIDPRFRGLGLAVRLVRHALAHAETPYTEALAAMGRVHPFFEKAGMTRYDPPARADDARLLAALDRVGIPPATLASARAMRARLARCEPCDRAWIERELRRWCAGAGPPATRGRHARAAPLDIILTAARGNLLSRPVYYLALDEKRVAS